MKIHKPLDEMTMEEMFEAVADPTSPHYIQFSPDIEDEPEQIDYYDETLDLMADLSEASLEQLFKYASTL